MVGSSKQSKKSKSDKGVEKDGIRWNDADTLTFLKIVLDMQTKNGFASIQWGVVSKRLKEVIGKEISAEKLKNKYSHVKARHSQWLKLRNNVTGAGWDPELHKVTASEEWWERQKYVCSRLLLEPRDRTFADVPHKIDSEARYSPFKGAVGCIDGVHMDCIISEADQLPYFRRNKFTSFNVMAVCEFDMFFTFILVGWEGSAHDAKVFDHAIRTQSLNFPHPPEGKYYLCDKGYPDKKGYLVPYSKVNYHKSQFGREAPKNQREGFNRLHSSLRTTIERCFGVLKKRWKVLKNMPFYPVETQVDVIIACFALHNFILAHKIHGTVEDEPDPPKPKIPDVSCYDSRERYHGVTGQGMGGIRDDIARAIWENRREWLYINY